MKNNLRVKLKRYGLMAGILLLVLLAGNQKTMAQGKTGYVNFNALLYKMPEIKTIEAQVNDYQKQFIDQLTTMNNELQTKQQSYETQKAAMTDAVRTARETELTDLQQRLTAYENDARQKVTEKSNTLLKPVMDKVSGTIALVAKEKGYTLVLEAASGNAAGKNILYAAAADDLSPAVEMKLGIN